MECTRVRWAARGLVGVLTLASALVLAASAAAARTERAAGAESEGMPALPVIVFGALVLCGLAAIAILVRRLNIRGARRATASLTADTALEDELQEMIAATAQAPRTG